MVSDNGNGDGKKKLRPRRGRGEGSVEELPSGKWRAVLSAGVDPATGKRRKLAATFDTKKQALTWLRERQHEQGRGGLADAGRRTVGDWLAEWLRLQEARLAPGGYDHDEKRVRLHLKPRLGPIPLARLTPLEVERALADMAKEGYSASERFKAGTVLRRALKVAMNMGLLASNPAVKVKLPKVNRPEKTALTEDQARALLAAAAGDRMGAALALALDLGCRPGELYALHWGDIDLDAGTVFIHRSLEERKGKLRLKETKTPKSRRRVKAAPRTLAVLEAHRERMRAEGRDVERGPVFVTARGNLWRRGEFRKFVLLPLLKRAGLPAVRVVDLRHSSATILLGRNVNVKVVSERLGHESIEITLKHYAHAMPDMQEKAAEALQEVFGPFVPPTSHGRGTRAGRREKLAATSSGNRTT